MDGKPFKQTLIKDHLRNITVKMFFLNDGSVVLVEAFLFKPWWQICTMTGTTSAEVNKEKRSCNV